MKTSVFIHSFAFVISLSVGCGQIRSQPNNQSRQFKKTEVLILSLTTTSDAAEQYNLTFGAKNDTTLKLTMLIGKNEAQTLVISLENMKPSAPLPFDIFQEAIEKFGYQVNEVQIDGLEGDIYTAKVICSGQGKTVELNARPVDAATIASKFSASIFVNDNLLRR